MHNLPPAFELVPKLLLLLDDPEADCDALLSLIRVDAALTAHIVRRANAVSVAHSYRSETLQDAVLRLGLREIFRITVQIASSPLLAASHGSASAALDLWRHSMAAAFACRTVAEAVGSDPEAAFTAGLLHDLGKTVLAQRYGSTYLQLVEHCSREHLVLWEHERQKLNTDHATTGAALLSEWSFPSRMVDAIQWHHQPLKCPRSPVMPAITNLGNTLSYRLGYSRSCPPQTANLDAGALQVLHLSPYRVERP